MNTTPLPDSFCFYPDRLMIKSVLATLSPRRMNRLLPSFPHPLDMEGICAAITRAPLSAATAETLAWLEPIFPGSPCASLHFTTSASASLLLPLAQKFLAAASSMFRYILATVPAPFRDVRAITELLGFELLCKIPCGSNLPYHNRIADLCLYGKKA